MQMNPECLTRDDWLRLVNTPLTVTHGTDRLAVSRESLSSQERTASTCSAHLPLRMPSSSSLMASMADGSVAYAFGNRDIWLMVCVPARPTWPTWMGRLVGEGEYNVTLRVTNQC